VGGAATGGATATGAAVVVVTGGGASEVAAGGVVVRVVPVDDVPTLEVDVGELADAGVVAGAPLATFVAVARDTAAAAAARDALIDAVMDDAVALACDAVDVRDETMRRSLASVALNFARVTAVR